MNEYELHLKNKGLGLRSVKCTLDFGFMEEWRYKRNEQTNWRIVESFYKHNFKSNLWQPQLQSFLHNDHICSNAMIGCYGQYDENGHNCCYGISWFSIEYGLYGCILKETQKHISNNKQGVNWSNGYGHSKNIVNIHDIFLYFGPIFELLRGTPLDAQIRLNWFW